MVNYFFPGFKLKTFARQTIQVTHFPTLGSKQGILLGRQKKDLSIYPVVMMSKNSRTKGKSLHS
jgi:hypothetical protein